ncbi:MAG: MurR/RpiR family transcriptional regulator [Candidatus Hydrogenedentales bacterium]
MQQIMEKYNSLRKSETKVADIILEHPEAAIHFSVSELAEQAGVSDPTVIRFCRSLGFKGFQDFKIYLAQSIIPGIRNIHETVNQGENVPDLVRKVFDANTAAIQSTLGTLDFASIDEAIKELSNARRIMFFGLGNSAVVAKDAYHKFFRIGIPCEWFEDSHMAMMAASIMKPGEVLVVISHSGSTTDIVDVLEVASKAGARSIAIVSHHKSPVSGKADYTLCVASTETEYKFEPMASRIAQLSVIDVLSVGVSLLHSDVYIANLEKSRKALVRKRY